jgi:hypothetical protein
MTMPAFRINGHDLASRFEKSAIARLGSARASRAGFGALAETNLVRGSARPFKKSSRWRGRHRSRRRGTSARALPNLP